MLCSFIYLLLAIVWLWGEGYFLTPLFTPKIVSSVGANCLSNGYSQLWHYNDDWGTAVLNIYLFLCVNA